MPVRQYPFVKAAKTPISFEFSNATRVAMLCLFARRIRKRQVFYVTKLISAIVGTTQPQTTTRSATEESGRQRDNAAVLTLGLRGEMAGPLVDRGFDLGSSV